MSPSTDGVQLPQISALVKEVGTVLKEPRLPSYEEVVGKVDSTRLPSYRESRQPRYHPYTRPLPRPVEPANEDRLFNTIYDDERIELIVPAARGRRGFRPLIPPLVPTPLIPNVNGHVRMIREPERDEALRRQHIGALILQEFVAAWPHCGARPA